MRYFIMLLLFVFTLSAWKLSDEWGFYGHRLINRMAVFTLPPEMMELYKPNIDFISEHAVDPDKRRYASVYEAIRHYIDLDHWGVYPYDDLPRGWMEALIKHTDLVWYYGNEDSMLLAGRDNWAFAYGDDTSGSHLAKYFDQDGFLTFYREHILAQYYEDPWIVDCELWSRALEGKIESPCHRVMVRDHLSETGVLPYFLLSMQRRLSRAFEEVDKREIIRLSAEMGHYVGDAHVPLHTTSNYNGQLTDQLGIHAFWESRIPELFAEADYDFFVGKADYIAEPEQYFWNIVLESNSYVDSVLLIEQELREVFASDQQYCFEERLGATVRTQCREYARAYQARMAGMVEERMRKSIKAIGDCWYTAWVDAGQPVFGSGSISSGWEVSDEKQADEVGVKGNGLKRNHE